MVPIEKGIKNILQNIKTGSFLRTLFLSTSLYASFSACNDDSSLYKAPCMPTYQKEMICDGLDNNCNGEKDEGCDDDKDGYCDAEMRVGFFDTSTHEENTQITNSYFLEPDFPCKKTFEINPFDAWLFMDCDDENSFAHPTTQELCNGFDDNCDGEKDNFFPEQGRACYVDKNSGEIFDASVVENSSTLENLCGPSQFFCEEGVLKCKDLRLEREICDGVDNNCDGITDELISSEPCYGGWGEVDGVMQYIDGLLEDSPWYGTLGVGECWSGDFTCTESCEILPEYITDCREHEMGGDQLCHGAITPLPEICDGKNNDCDLDGIDEDYDRDADTYTTCGTFARRMESVTPLLERMDCDDTDTEVHPGALEIICNRKDDDCNPETVDSIDRDEDSFPIDCVPDIPFDCDDNVEDDLEFCFSIGVEDCLDRRYSSCAPCINPAAPERCGDCRDNDCDGIIDENATAGRSYSFFMHVDISGSMSEENFFITEALSQLLLEECISTDGLSITTILVGDWYTYQPILAGVQESIGEFRENYAARIPLSSAGQEYMLDALAYQFCSKLEEDFLISGVDEPVRYLPEYTEICIPLQTETILVWRESGSSETIHPLEDFLAGHDGSELWREGVENKVIFLADEEAQTRFSYIDQFNIGQLARHLQVEIALYVPETYFNTEVIRDGVRGAIPQGYAYLICDSYDAAMNCIGRSNGEMKNLTDLAYSGRIGQEITEQFIEIYCPEEIEEEEEEE
ncbi:putative metal-binding motif-containing protein [Candidatus Woesearchaeota archaeon]|nr:putative metal-binding motif-containing protein [Candidatus Woesearchaeota archaeon]